MFVIFNKNNVFSESAKGLGNSLSKYMAIHFSVLLQQ